MTQSPVPQNQPSPSRGDVFRALVEKFRPRGDAESRRMAMLMGLGAFILLADVRRRPNSEFRSKLIIAALAASSLAGNLAVAVYMISLSVSAWTGRPEHSAVIGLALSVVVAIYPLYFAGQLTGPGGDPMPSFTLKGKDRLAIGAIDAYHAACEAEGLDVQAEQVALARTEFDGWQRRQPWAMRYPDHTHVPVSTR